MKNRQRISVYAKWTILAIGSIVALLALWYINQLSRQIREAEQQKIAIWANAISQKTQVLRTTDQFFQQIALDEQRKMQLYTQVLRSLGSPDLNSDVQFSLAYVNYIMDSTAIATIIVDKDSVITSCRNIINDSLDALLIGQKLQSPLLDQFTHNQPFHYRVWGMPFTLYYRESAIYTNLRQTLNNLNQNLLDEITNNTISVPVLIVDTTRQTVLGHGNLEHDNFATPEALQTQLRRMERSNDPLQLMLADGCSAYVYYQSTPLLRALRWMPLVYLFISFILIALAYNLFRTTRTMEQNRIWVGLAKETAHQLGTPISSLQGWVDYLEGKTLTPTYSTEIRKDLSRLETITHRFSKIGSVPQLVPTDLSQVLQETVDYLRKRAPRNIKIILNLPEEPLVVPLSKQLFEWVIENLCKNAIDAMNGRGTITIIASEDARYIHLDVADTGKGIPVSQQKKIFQSGYTTKTRGWGLGLALAKRIIEQYHQGRINLKYSVEGQGTVFHIVLKK